MTTLWTELGRTVRYAIKEWPATIRLVVIMVAVATILVVTNVTGR